MILPVLLTAVFGLAAWTAPRPACALGDTQGTPTQDGPDVVPLDELPPPGGPVRLDEVALPGVTPREADGLVAASRAYGAVHPEAFAGLLLAQGRLWLGFTADAASHLAAARATVERPDLLRAFVADFAEGELLALQERITQDLSRLADESVEVAMVGVDVRRNRVEIGLRSVGGDAPAALARRYGTAMLLVSENVVLRTLPAPVPRQTGPADDGGARGPGNGPDRGGCRSSQKRFLHS